MNIFKKMKNWPSFLANWFIGRSKREVTFVQMLAHPFSAFVKANEVLSFENWEHEEESGRVKRQRCDYPEDGFQNAEETWGDCQEIDFIEEADPLEEEENDPFEEIDPFKVGWRLHSHLACKLITQNPTHINLREGILQTI